MLLKNEDIESDISFDELLIVDWKNESNWRRSYFSTMLIYPSFVMFKLLVINVISLHSNSYSNVVWEEIHVNHLHVYHSDHIKKEKTMIVNTKIEEKRGGVVTDICLLIFF